MGGFRAHASVGLTPVHTRACVCFTEMLTSHGWSSAMTIESVLLAIRANMLVGGARLELRNQQDYSEAEAREAFNRMVREHGWY